jgi:hypothetical protein
MPSKFVQKVNSFLVLEAHDGGWADIALDYGYTLVADDKGKEGFRKDQEHISVGELRSSETLRKKVFPDASPNHFRGVENPRLTEMNFGDAGDNRSTANPILERFRSYQDFIRARAEAEGLTLDQMLEVIAAENERERVAELESPDLHRAMLRRFLHQLDQITEDVKRMEVLPISWDKVPAQLRILLSNAHEASLLGQEVASAVLCGTALEEALRIRLGRGRFDGLAQGISVAISDSVLDPKSPESVAAWDIKEMRNIATHDPGHFLVMVNRKKRDVLMNTRFVISHLFAPSEEFT